MMAIEPLSLQPRRVPICIGITGHIDVHPEDLARARREFSDFLDFLIEAFPDTPLRLISSLALGADRVAARVFLDKKENFRNIRPELAALWELVVPLPLPKSLYVHDFPGEIDEFEKIIAEASLVFSLPVRPGFDISSISQQGSARDLQYRDASRYIATHCDILVAMWDGLDSGKIGGTCDAIRLRIQAYSGAVQIHFSPLSEITWPVFHISVRRIRERSDSQPAADLAAGVWRLDGLETEIAKAEDFRKMDRFNKKVKNINCKNFENQSHGFCRNR